MSRAVCSAKERLSEDDDGLQQKVSQPAGEAHPHDMESDGDAGLGSRKGSHWPMAGSSARTSGRRACRAEF